MARLIKPVLFSQHLGLDGGVFEKYGIIDPLLNCDTRLFIDPLLISTSQFERIREDGFEQLKTRFSNVIRLIHASKSENDVAWRNAARLLSLAERPETCLGYGGASTSGSSRPAEIKAQVLRTAREILELGENDPEIISLMGLFEDGIGPDTISDMATNCILPALCTETEEFCKTHDIPVINFDRYDNHELPTNPFTHGKAIIFVPRDIVRDLPLAADWSDVSRVVMEIEEIRNRVNSLLGNLTKATIADKKRALKEASMQSLDAFRHVFNSLRAASNHYDPNEDVFNFYAFRKIISQDLSAFADQIAQPIERNRAELERVVVEIIDHFKRMIEHNNLWEMMWNDDRPKRERAAQLLFFAVADSFCKANDLDISPETNMGGGPVDFKFSHGYRNRIVVEIKLSKGTIVHGYQKQLEIYKQASETDAGFFLIMDVGGIGNKFVTISRVRRQRLDAGERASEIFVVDSKRRASASKRD